MLVLNTRHAKGSEGREGIREGSLKLSNRLNPRC
jgi:hypothetical protein